MKSFGLLSVARQGETILADVQEVNGDKASY